MRAEHADEALGRGMPRGDAHAVVGQFVVHCRIQHGLTLALGNFYFFTQNQIYL